VNQDVDPAAQDAAAAVQNEPVEDPQPPVDDVQADTVSEEEEPATPSPSRSGHGATGARGSRFAQLPAPKKFNIHKLPKYDSDDEDLGDM
jgi:hypothetical protein